jgi:hypothetical protein
MLTWIVEDGEKSYIVGSTNKVLYDMRFFP